MDGGISSSELLAGGLDFVNDDLRESHLVSVHQVVQAVARQLDPREVLPLICEKALALTGAESTAVVLLDPARSTLDFVAVAGANASEIVGQRVSVDDALLGHTALTGDIYIAHNLTQAQPLLPSLDPERPAALGARSIAVVPIFLGGSSVGVIAAMNRADGESFGGTDVLRLQMLAGAASVTLGQQRLRGEARQQQRERNILLNAARAGAASLNVQEVLQSVLTTIGASMEMSAGAVFLLNDERTRLYVAAQVGLTEDDRERQIEADNGWAAHILAGGVAKCVADAEADPLLEDLPLPGVRSLLVAPLTSRSAADGLIVVASRLPGAFSSLDTEMLTAVAGQAAVALENAWLFEDATRRAQEATAIYEMSQSIGATLQIDRVLNFVADSVLHLLHVDRFALFLHNPRTDRLEIQVARNLSAQAATTIHPRRSEGIAGWVLEFATPTAVQDVAADHRNRSAPIDQEGVTSLVSVPLQVGDGVIGVIHAMSTRRRLFTVGEMELLYTIANQVAAAIVNARLFSEAQHRKAELRKSVRRVARVLGSSTDLKKAAQIIADLALEMVEADRSVVYTLDSVGRPVPRAAANFRSAAGAMGIALGMQSPAAWVARRGRSLKIAAVAADTRYEWPDFVGRDRVTSYVAVPLRLGDEAVGVVEVYSRETSEFAAEDVRWLLTFASQASVALKNAVLTEQTGARLRELNALNAVSSRLYGTGSIESLCRDALAIVCEATRSDIGIVRVFSPDLTILHHGASAVGDDVAEETTAVAAAMKELVDWVRQYGEAIQVPARDVTPAPISTLAVPVRKGPGECRAVIALSRVAPALEYDTSDRRFLETAANLLNAGLT